MISVLATRRADKKKDIHGNGIRNRDRSSNRRNPKQEQQEHILNYILIDYKTIHTIYKRKKKMTIISDKR